MPCLPCNCLFRLVPDVVCCVVQRSKRPSQLSLLRVHQLILIFILQVLRIPYRPMTTPKLLPAKKSHRLAACAPVLMEMRPVSPTGVAPALALALRPTFLSMKARPPWLQRVLRVAESNVARLGKRKIPNHVVPQMAQSAPRFTGEMHGKTRRSIK